MIEISHKWDLRFLELAKHIATWSKDRSTKVGAVVVGPDKEIRSTGFNGFPRGCNDNNEEWHQRPLKYLVTEHAERNSVFFAALRGVSLTGCTIYITTAPCSDCARAIISSGIRRVVWPAIVDAANLPKGDWAEQVRVGKMLLTSAGVCVDELVPEVL